MPKRRRKLGLETKSVDLTFTTTGNSSKFHKGELEVEFLLQSLNNDFTSLPIQADTIQQVSWAFKQPIINVENLPHLSSVVSSITEDYSFEPEHDTVDLLIGNTYSLLLGNEKTLWVQLKIY